MREREEDFDRVDLLMSISSILQFREAAWRTALVSGFTWSSSMSRNTTWESLGILVGRRGAQRLCCEEYPELYTNASDASMCTCTGLSYLSVCVPSLKGCGGLACVA